MDSAWEVFHKSCCGWGCISVEVMTDGTEVATTQVSLNVGIPTMADGSGRTPSAAGETPFPASIVTSGTCCSVMDYASSEHGRFTLFHSLHEHLGLTPH